MKAILFALVGSLLLAPAVATRNETSEIVQVLDALHRAASDADEETYFGLFAPDAVFLGSAVEERWTIDEFRAYAHPHFATGRGWTYTPRPDMRHVIVSPEGHVAWFDEVLDSAKYGECRGTGVLRKVDAAWKIAQYNLTIPVPNEIALDVVDRIRALADPDDGPTACSGNEYDVLDFWLGRWDVMVGDRKVGTNHIEKILGGCAVMERWVAADGARGKSLFYYVAAHGEWNQVWVTSRGSAPGGVKHKRLVEKLSDGALRFQGSIPCSDGLCDLDRTTLTPLKNGRVRQHIEVSSDDGATWRTTFDAVYVPR